MGNKIWGGRFREKPDAIVDQFNASIHFDRRLYAQDIEGSKAHCRMLAAQGIIAEAESAMILEALDQIRTEIDEGKFVFDESQEDIHSLVEKTLVERVGAVGEKLHTGRSRNDQVSLDARLYVRDAIDGVMSLIREVQIALVDSAEKNPGCILPGYTHLQRAQPVLLAHHLLAYYEMMKRDGQRFLETRRRVNILPLGSAALAGATFDLDRHAVAKELGFESISENSMDAVSDRDFLLEFLFNASLVMMHLSRLAEELVIWSSHEFGFVTLPDSLSTGSSIMPQKKNPDLPELVRGKTGRAYGHLMGLLTTMKGLPLAYNKDLQEDKEALFDTVDTLEQCLVVMARLLREITFNEKVMGDAAKEGYLAATDLADYLVGKGLTFRKAHETVGMIVLSAMEQEKELHEVSLEALQAASPEIGEDVFQWLDPGQCVKRRELPGGTGPGAVRKQLKKAREELES